MHTSLWLYSCCCCCSFGTLSHIHWQSWQPFHCARTHFIVTIMQCTTGILSNGINEYSCTFSGATWASNQYKPWAGCQWHTWTWTTGLPGGSLATSVRPQRTGRWTPLEVDCIDTGRPVTQDILLQSTTAQRYNTRIHVTLLQDTTHHYNATTIWYSTTTSCYMQ